MSESFDLSSAVAVVGMAGRFPGAASVAEFWKNLREGRESVRYATEAELASTGLDSATYRDPAFVPAHAGLDAVGDFDAAFFGMSPREAELTDPQHRIFLECASEALEVAGYDSFRFSGAIGLFAGVGANGYLLHHLVPNADLVASAGGLALLIGNEKDNLTTRVGYKLDLRGPCIGVQTACSTSLVAVQMAVQSLLVLQSDLALAGGVSIHFPLQSGYRFEKGSILSPDGHCRPFDRAAQGTVSGDGAGVVALRRLEDALRDGDHIHAIIRGAAVNNDGSIKVGYTAPSIDGQVEVISLAQAIADVSAESIGYVEAHGTGTELGDSVEVAALTAAFRRSTDRRGFCALGSAKANIGHLNTAAGIASFIKATLAVEHGYLPGNIHFESPGAKLRLEESPFFVNASGIDWPGKGIRRAGVSSFGFGGTNAHVILEERPEPTPAAPSGPQDAHVLGLSARSPEALSRAQDNLAKHLEAHPELDLADVAFTLREGRRRFSYRSAVVARGGTPVTEWCSGQKAATEEPLRIAFLFPGQGTRAGRVARSLYRSSPAFRESIDRSREVLARDGFMLEKYILEQEDGLGTAALQPTLLAIELALVDVLQSLGLRPDVMLGHSLGEYAAAAVAGVVSRDDVLRWVLERGRQMEACAPGAMLAVACSVEGIEHLSDDVFLAAVNAPKSLVVSGTVDAIERFDKVLGLRGIASRRLKVDRAFHSKWMRPAVEPLLRFASKLQLQAPSIPYASNVTGKWIADDEARSPEYWANHLAKTVQFSAGVTAILQQPRTLCIEVGPSRVLGQLVAQHASDPAPRVAFMWSPQDPEWDVARVYAAAAQAWADGRESVASISMRRRRVPLPTYPFERKRCWVDAPKEQTSRAQLSERVLVAELGLGTEEEVLRTRLGIRGVRDHAGLEPLIHRWCARLVLDYLLGAGIESQRAVGLGHVRQHLRLLPKFERLLDEFIAILCEEGWASREGEQVRLTPPTELEAAAAIEAKLRANYPGFNGIFRFIAHCYPNFDAALSGRIPAIGVLYPNGSSSLIAACERETVEHRSERLYLMLLREAVERVVKAAGRRVRILEVGGGIGTLTWSLMTALQHENIEYVFTDLGRTFVVDAEAEAKRRGLDAKMLFSVLDVSKPHHDLGTFDVIVGFNVVHAARNVRVAVQSLVALLAPGGLFGVVEAVRIDRWDVLTWGLAEGWWHFDDDRVRSPLLSPEAWTALFSDVGLEAVEAYPAPSKGDSEDHALILARWPGGARRVDVGRPREVVREAATPLPVVALTDLEGRIAKISKELLGLKEIGVQDDFYALGADSLITLRIADRIRRDLGLEVPEELVFRGATVASLASALNAPQTEDSSVASALVCLHKGGTRPPLFFVHPASGVVFPYVELARRIGGDQPFYALQARGLDGKAPPDKTVAEMAEHYIAAMRALQPKGPYHLGGFSFGALVAYEIGLRLTNMGETVALLALVDEPAPCASLRPTSLEMMKVLGAGMWRSFLPHLHDYLYLMDGAPSRRSAPERWTSFLARSTMANFVPAEARQLVLGQPAVMRMFKLFMMHIEETKKYAPPPGKLHVTLFKATKLGRRFAKDQTWGWGELALLGVDVFDVPGEHLTVLRQPNVEALADRLRQLLSRPNLGPVTKSHSRGADAAVI